MNDDILLLCDAEQNVCNEWRVSAWDPVYKRLWLQGHSVEGVALATVGFTTNARDNITWYMNVYSALDFGFTGFQFATIVH
jgi:hypothetical protein